MNRIGDRQSRSAIEPAADTASTLQTRSRAGPSVAIVALGTVILTWCGPAAYRSLPLHAPDTASYLSWDPFRPALYPLFLSLVGPIDSTLNLVGPIQLITVIASVSWLALTIANRFHSIVAAVAFAASVLWHPQVVSYAFTALPESFLMAAAALSVRSAIQLQANATTRVAWQHGLVLAAAVLLKPVALAWLAGLLVLALTIDGGVRRRMLIVVVTALSLPVTAASAANYLRIGEFAPQLGAGYATLGVTATLIEPESRLEPEALRDALASELAQIRTELNLLPSLEWYYFYSSHAYHITLLRAREVIYQQFGVSDQTPWLRQYSILNEIGHRIAMVGLRENFPTYVRHVTAHLYGLWLMPLVKDAADVEFLTTLKRVAGDVPTLAATPLMYRRVPSLAYWLHKTGLVGSLVLSCVSLVLMLRRTGPTWRAVAYAAATLHGYFILTAAAQTGLPRYALGAWPLTMFVLCAGALASVRPWCPHKEPDRTGRQSDPL